MTTTSFTDAKTDGKTLRMESAGGNRVPQCLLSEERHTVLDFGRVRRVALAVAPHSGGDAIDQAWEAISTIRAVMRRQQVAMTVTMQTIFVRSVDEIPAIRRLVEAYYGEQMPSTAFVAQPPCDGQALAIEAWAVGGEGVDVGFPEPGTVTVEYDGFRWIYINGIAVAMDEEDAYGETRRVFGKLARCLESAGATFNDVARLWFYQPGITEIEKNPDSREMERYRELNRSRTDYFEELEAAGKMSNSRDGRAFYPASTGIGMVGGGLTAGCTAVRFQREDVRLIPLENPNQTAAFDYARRFSVKSPKFSRAMAMLTRDYAVTWISGTASILDSESVHLGDVEKQTEQTIDNIEALIGAENFSRHGVGRAGALPGDLARVRVYVKRREDYEKCRAVCERRLHAVPAIYVIADVCRPELLVEIEGVAFSKLSP